DLCVECMACVGACGVGAISSSEDGPPTINDAACQSCGVCVPACPTGAIQIRNYREIQVAAEISALFNAIKGGAQQ
ncbi:MAG: hypothetical protein DRO87_03340, partial [Candidatus Thorarchaeota archaeon]